MNGASRVGGGGLTEDDIAKIEGAEAVHDEPHVCDRCFLELFDCECEVEVE